MMDPMKPPLSPPPADCAPDACTLPTAERPLRIAEFDDLFRTAAVSVERLGPRRARWALRSDPAVPARAADLVARESRCCSFFDFALRMSGGTVALEVAVPGEYGPVLDALVERSRPAMVDP
jgi:hypothetical protein